MRALVAALAVAAAGMAGVAGPVGIPAFPAGEALGWLFWLLPAGAVLGLVGGRARLPALGASGLLASFLCFAAVVRYRWGDALGGVVVVLLGLALGLSAWAGGRAARAGRSWILALLGVATALTLATTGSLRLGIAGAGLSLGLILLALSGRRIPTPAPAGVVGGLGLGLLLASGPLLSGTPWWLAALIAAGLLTTGGAGDRSGI